MLILAPTRELAVQIADDVEGFSYHTDITSVAVYGGVEMGPQERALEAGVDIVVATPGRLMDHMRHDAVDLLRVQVPGSVANHGWCQGVQVSLALVSIRASRYSTIGLFAATIRVRVS